MSGTSIFPFDNKRKQDPEIPVKNGHSPTVFIVDDDEAVRYAISMLVESCGWQAEEYASAEEFLEILPARHSNGHGTGKNCLVVDLNMPGMDGADLVETLVARSWWLPIIVVTGYNDGPLAGRARRAGVQTILKKPFNDQLLLGHIRRALENM